MVGFKKICEVYLAAVHEINSNHLFSANTVVKYQCS